MKYTLLSIILICYNITYSQVQTFNYNGSDRQYTLHIPSNLPNDAPLVFVLHGYSGSANNIKNYSGMDQVANNNNFAVCYPNGTRDQWNYRFWNVGYDFHQNSTVDDIGFLIALAQYLQNEYQLSAEKTFSTGMSNGGDMSYLLACQASNIFSAVAPVAGCMMEWIQNSCSPSKPIPVLEIHGTNDNTTLWNGDMNNNDGYGAYLPTNDGINFWVQLNNCTTLEIDTLLDLDPSDGSIVITEKHKLGIENNQVWLYTILNGDHDWPGSYGNMDINSSEVIWDFFNQNINNASNIIETNNNIEKKLLKQINILGEEILKNYNGIIINIYTDGTTSKKMQLN